MTYHAPESIDEATPEMIAAGVEAVRAVNYNLWETTDPAQLSRLVKAVFDAMQARSQDRHA